MMPVIAAILRTNHDEYESSNVPTVGMYWKICDYINDDLLFLFLGEAMEKGLRDCCRSIRIGKILIKVHEETKQPMVSGLLCFNLTWLVHSLTISINLLIKLFTHTLINTNSLIHITSNE